MKKLLILLVILLASLKIFSQGNEYQHVMLFYGGMRVGSEARIENMSKTDSINKVGNDYTFYIGADPYYAINAAKRAQIDLDSARIDAKVELGDSATNPGGYQSYYDGTVQDALIATNSNKTILDLIPKTYYVSNNGSDSNSGTLDAPWLTISKVNSEMSNFTGDDKVAFQCGGVYNDAQLTITSDSLTITSYGSGDKPVISSLQTLMSPSSEGGGVYSYSTTDRIMQVFQDGEWLYPSRWPDSRDTTRLGPVQDIAANTFTDTIDLAAITPGAMIHIKRNSWSIGHFDIDTYGVGGAARDTIEFDDAVAFTPSATYGYYLTGITSEIDDGEWSYDTDEDKLYIDLLRGDTNAEITVTSGDTAISIYAEGCKIENIEVRGANDVGIACVLTSTDYTIDNVDFYYCNKYAIHGVDANNLLDITIRNCSIYYTGGVGIRITDARTNLDIQDNYIYGTGTWVQDGDIYGNGGATQGYGDAMHIEDCENVVIKNNTIEKCARMGIFIEVGYNHTHMIDNNLIKYPLLFTGDAGAIDMNQYSTIVSRASYDTVQNNTIIGGRGSFKGWAQSAIDVLTVPNVYGIYIDNAVPGGDGQMSNVRILNNKIDSTRNGILLHAADNIDINNNTIDHCWMGIITSDVAEDGEIDSVRLNYNTIKNYSNAPMRFIDNDDATSEYPQEANYNVVVGSSSEILSDVFYSMNNTGGTTNYNLINWRELKSDSLDDMSSYFTTQSAANEFTTLNGLAGRLKQAVIRLAPDLHTSANAASDPNKNEADATTGWTSVNLSGGANVFESQGAVKYTGSYSLHSDADDTPTDEARFYIDLEALGVEDMDRCRLSFAVRHIGSGGAWRVNLGAGTTTQSTYVQKDLTSSDITFDLVEYEWTHDGTYRYFIVGEYSGTNNGGVYFDDFSVKKLYGDDVIGGDVDLVARNQLQDSLGWPNIIIDDTIIFTNGATISNEETDTLFITETVVKITGELAVTGHTNIDDITINGTIYVIDATGNDSLLIYDDGDTARIFSNNNPIKIGEGSLVVGTDGNVGIGESSPLDILHVTTDNACIRLEDNSGNYGRLKVGNSQLTIQADPDNVVASTDIVFDMDGSEVARFLQGGNFGVGSIAPTEKIEVEGNVIAQRFATKLWDVTGGHFETATTGVEYYSPNQHGGIYGTIYRQYFPTTLPASLTSGNNVTGMIDYATQFKYTGTDRGVGHGNATAYGSSDNHIYIMLGGASGSGNLSLATTGYTLQKGFVDYTK